MVTVKVRKKGLTKSRIYKTRALLDSGSNRSFCTEQLTKTLKIEGQTVNCTMETLSGEDEYPTTEVDLEVVGMGMRWSQALSLHKVLVKNKLPEALDTAMATGNDIARWEHLQGIDAPIDVNACDSVEILIGLDTPQAMLPLEIKAGRDGEAFAIRPRLG